ncbi:hypothetical protein D3C83_152920 [compost metagenome]
MPLHLLHQVIAGLLVGEVQPVLIDQHFLLLEPLLPRFLRNVVEHLLAEGPGIGREIKTFSLTAEFHALDHSCHVGAPH